MPDDNCWNCRETEQKFRCTGCGLALYCSNICQKEHWKSLHGSHCKFLSGKKSLPGAVHTYDTCTSCKNESADYNHLHKKDSSGMACHLKMLGSDVFMRSFIFSSKYQMNFKIPMTNIPISSSVNFPIEFGEITGHYLDYLDKLFSMLLSLLCHLRFRYPKVNRVAELLKLVTNFRGYHWSNALKTGVISERINLTMEFIRFLYSGDWILELNEVLGKFESQTSGVTAWNSFMFLYEMLGVCSVTHPMLTIDLDSINEEDKSSVNSAHLNSLNIKGKGHQLCILPLKNNVYDFREQLESLDICDENYQLKSFQEIYLHFETLFGAEFLQSVSTDVFQEVAADQTSIEEKETQQIKLVVCELCWKAVDIKNCHYVFHSILFFDMCLMKEKNRKNSFMFENFKKACATMIDPEKAYITYSIGSGMRVICNEGDCKGVFMEHVAFYRISNGLSLTSIINKYEQKFADFRCWTCKLYSGKSHRCSTCKSRLYCSQECQNKDWKIHQTICNDLKESGTQVKIDSQERKENSNIYTEKKFQEQVTSCKCGKSDCEMVKQIKMLYGKTNNEQQTEEEVD